MVVERLKILDTKKEKCNYDVLLVRVILQSERMDTVRMYLYYIVNTYSNNSSIPIISIFHKTDKYRRVGAP